MAERVKDDQHTQRIAPARPGSEPVLPDSLPHGVRIDPPHPMPSELAAHDVEWRQLEHFVPEQPAAPPAPSKSPVDGPFDSRSVDEVTQYFQRFLSQRAIQEQRERELLQQKSAFDEEQKRRLDRLARDQMDIDAKIAQSQKHQAALAEGLLALETQSRKFEAERQNVLKERAELERRKKSIREEVIAELQSDREELERAQAEFQKDLEQFHVVNEALHTRLESLAEENKNTLQYEREQLWESLSKEWEQRNQEFSKAKSDWDKARDLERSELDREKAMFEAAVKSANEEFLNARQALALELAEAREAHATELQIDRDAWEQKRAVLDAETTAARENLTRELDALRLEHDANLRKQAEEWEEKRRQDELELKTSQEALKQELEEARQKFATEMGTERTQWEVARGHEECELLALRDSLQQEIDDRRDQVDALIETQRAEWEETRRRGQAEIDAANAALSEARQITERELAEARQQHAAALRQAEAEWAQVREEDIAGHQAQRSDLIAACQALKTQIKIEREEHESAVTTERTEWEAIREGERARFQNQQEEWNLSRDSMLQASRDALELEFMTLRQQHASRLQTEREEWDQTMIRERNALDEHQAELMRERTLIENRIRFQQDHLDKCRIELEQAQNDFRRQRQLELQNLEEAGMMLLRRLKQIDLYRASIDAREKSLDREHEVFTRTRKALSNTADLDRLNFQAERHAWEQERQIQQQEVRRQQEVLSTKAEGLESRRARLDKLRIELEETHRGTLEMRLAVEEAWAQLTQVADPEDARQRVEQVRQSLMGYYQQMHETMAEQRREQADVQAKFERMRAEFAEERQKLTNWLTSRDEELKLGEERLRIAANEAAANHTKWLTARDRWLIEKAEAEHLIRRLLSSLGENNRDMSRDPELVLRMEQIGARTDDDLTKLREDVA